MKQFEELHRKLPRVGQTVRSKDHHTLWRVVEKREMWQNVPGDPKVGELQMIPAIHLTYWKVEEGGQPGVGRMMGYLYTAHDNTFEAHWEVVGIAD